MLTTLATEFITSKLNKIVKFLKYQCNCIFYKRTLRFVSCFCSIRCLLKNSCNMKNVLTIFMIENFKKFRYKNKEEVISTQTPINRPSWSQKAMTTLCQMELLNFLWLNWVQYLPLAPTQIDIPLTTPRAGSKFTQVPIY